MKLIRVATLLCAVVIAPAQAWQAQTARPKQVLILYWDTKDYPANFDFDRYLKAALQAAGAGPMEYYTESLDSTRFPGENQTRLLLDYLRQKYAGRLIDVLVAPAGPALDFLLANRREFLPNTPIVFASTEQPPAAQLRAEAGAAGIIYVSSYRRTLDLALGLHPDTQHVFIVNANPSPNESFEAMAKNDLRGFKSNAVITYLTNLPLKELMTKLSNLPGQSIVLYVWQQARNSRGQLLRSQEVLSLIAPSVKVPMYGMSFANVGRGIVGGYVWTMEGQTAKLADLILKVTNGARPMDIPIENSPVVPMFDWRQLQRWGIHEASLPEDSIIRFHDLSFWQQYKWRVVGVIVVFALQTVLVGALLVQRRWRRWAHEELKANKDRLEDLVQERTAELVAARDEAVTANRAKSVFLANMSHELRTPLNAILGFSGIMRRDASLSNEHRRDLGIVASSGEHLLQLIDDVLDMVKIETGSTTVEITAVDLHGLVNDIVNLLRERAQAKSLELLLDISPDAPRFVHSDSGKLRQILTNLIGNAVKYTDEGGVVVKLGSRRADGSSKLLLIFEVEDTGLGIPLEEQTRIFEPFVQAANAKGRTGTGLGLNISRRLVELLGGKIQVDSRPGVGSRFRLEVPATEAEITEIPTPVSRKRVIGLEAGQPVYRILIVEDRPESSSLLFRLLEPVGFQVRLAADGAQAVEAFRTWNPHFIWMDLLLPVMSGIEAAKRIRGLEDRREVKIAALTALAFNGDREPVISSDFDDFLRKPYHLDAIFSCMQRHLGLRYVYGSAAENSTVSPSVSLRAEELAALPTVLRDELEGALLSLDPDEIALVVRKISGEDRLLGKALGKLVDRLTYSPILSALRKCKRGATETHT